MSVETITLQRTAIRPLLREDLDAVVAIDAEVGGRTRRGYFERRLDAALREPKLHAQLAAVDKRGLVGFILARVLEGEFGRSEPGLRLEVVGVRTTMLNASHTVLPLAFGALGSALGMGPVFWAMSVFLLSGSLFSHRRRRRAE